MVSRLLYSQSSLKDIAEIKLSVYICKVYYLYNGYDNPSYYDPFTKADVIVAVKRLRATRLRIKVPLFSI